LENNVSENNLSVAVVTFTSEEKRTDNVLKFIQANPKLPLAQFMIANKFAEMARFVIENCPRCPQRTHALNDLKTAKDAAVCATLDEALS
jgi:hypothetical protein